MNAALAALTLARLLSVPSALVAETFPDHDTSGWEVRADIYREDYSDGTHADLVDVYATPRVGLLEYFLSVAPAKSGELAVCAVYARPRGAARWSHVTTNTDCE